MSLSEIVGTPTRKKKETKKQKIKIQATAKEKKQFVIA